MSFPVPDRIKLAVLRYRPKMSTYVIHPHKFCPFWSRGVSDGKHVELAGRANTVADQNDRALTGDHVLLQEGQLVLDLLLQVEDLAIGEATEALKGTGQYQALRAFDNRFLRDLLQDRKSVV